ncbi:hypothetical protein PFICI_05896 [Pestalotiopsis fici W106-1]|uniref:Uncharacterized protein n=1 Tax=Pestalotiopsis fici (strain W106-1 / CGMCC3.15140) TaxID=1229662 RepID=W3XD90_PESFW|nr:uncharacterized protein PFICI_05896 [Pestalotiopsis fici W106-1]ETS84020.1 hypothetical protein PFICI_05896 [Pestalotiopsis fici W106-1]
MLAAISTSTGPAGFVTPPGEMPDGYTPEQPKPSDQPQNPAPEFHKLLQDAMSAMQMRNSRSLLVALEGLTQMPTQDLEEAIATLPRTTISELLWSLDPHQISRDHDPTYGYFIGPGMWQYLNLGAVVDEWGSRKLYVKLLLQMTQLLKVLVDAGHIPNVNDYVPLLRAAGLASDMVVAKLLWEQMQTHNIAPWRHYDIFHEFIKARFLVDPAYYGFDKKRLMMTPRNLHRRGVYLQASNSRLDRLRKNNRRQMFKFGLNRNVAHGEDLTRRLRKPMPLTRVFYHLKRKGIFTTEQLLCTFIIAFARSGSLRFIQYRILEDYFGIVITRDADENRIRVERMSSERFTFNNPLRPQRPFIRPTSRLLDAVVYAFCSNGQFATAWQLVRYISQTYKLSITQQVWSNLLEWCYILITPPTSTAWKMAGFQDQIPRFGAMEFIWHAMKSSKYGTLGAQPEFKDYDLYIMNRLSQGKVSHALTLMHEAQELYEAQCAAYDAAAFDYAAVMHVGVDCTRERRKFQRQRFRKSYMRQRMRIWGRMIQRCFQPDELNDPIATQRIPSLIEAWGGILSNPVKYRTASGMVSLLDPAEPVEQTIFVRNHTTQIPMRRQGEWNLKTLQQRQVRLLSRYAVGDLLSTRLHPLEVWKGVAPQGRPSQSRRLDDHRAWEAHQRQAAKSEAGEVSALNAEEFPAPVEDIWDEDD